MARNDHNRRADGSNVEAKSTQKGDPSGSASRVDTTVALFSPRTAPVSKVLAAPAMSTSMASPDWTRRLWTTRIARASLACWKVDLLPLMPKWDLWICTAYGHVEGLRSFWGSEGSSAWTPGWLSSPYSSNLPVTTAGPTTCDLQMLSKRETIGFLSFGSQTRQSPQLLARDIRHD